MHCMVHHDAKRKNGAELWLFEWKELCDIEIQDGVIELLVGYHFSLNRRVD